MDAFDQAWLESTSYDILKDRIARVMADKIDQLMTASIIGLGDAHVGQFSGGTLTMDSLKAAGLGANMGFGASSVTLKHRDITMDLGDMHIEIDKGVKERAAFMRYSYTLPVLRGHGTNSICLNDFGPSVADRYADRADFGQF